MKHFPLIILALLVIPFSAYAQNDVKITRLKDNIHMLVSPGGGNVVASTGEDGTFIIDDQLTGRSEIIEAAIKSISDQDIKFILNTHYHFDHSGGNEFFGKKNAIIVAHDNVRKRLSTRQFITYFNKELPPLSKAGLPVVTFANDITFYYNGDSIKITHFPAAHTDGDAVAHFTNENIIVAGDLIFNGMYPFIDIEHGGSVEGIIAALDVLLKLADEETLIVPGHGPLMGKVDLQAYRQALATISERVKSAIKEGQTLEQVTIANPTQEFDESMGKGMIGPDTFVSILYEDLRR